MYILENEFNIVKVEIPDDFDCYSGFMRAVRRLDNSSTPGYPHCTEYPTIGEFLGFNGFDYDQFRLDRLWFQVQLLLDGNFEVMFNVFIKEEPHKLSKIEVDRFRLIIGSPLPFQVLCHMLFDFFNDKVIENAYELPTQQGIVLNGGSWRNFRHQWVSLGLNMGVDKSAWDWTVPGWKIELVMKLRLRLVFGSKYDRWCNLVERAYRALYDDAMLILSDGRVFKQVYPGVMKSGCVNTISDNSLMQIIDHILVCEDLGTSYRPLPRALGDDTLQSSKQVVDMFSYERYGCVVKSATEGLEFAGMDFKFTGPEPLYFEKHLFKVPYSKAILSDYLDAMLRMYVYSHRFDFWLQLSQSLGVGHLMRSKAYYLAWYEYGFD